MLNSMPTQACCVQRVLTVLRALNENKTPPTQPLPFRYRSRLGLQGIDEKHVPYATLFYFLVWQLVGVPALAGHDILQDALEYWPHTPDHGGGPCQMRS